MKGKSPPRAFTLLELLVAISIVAILAALLFPAAKGIFAASKTTRCLSNLNQIRIAALSYSSDHEGSPLPSSFWFVLNDEGYLATNSPVWICPADARTNKTAAGVTASYGQNGTLLGIAPTYWKSPAVARMIRVNEPSKTVYFSDADVYYMGSPYWPYWRFRHGGKINALFFDYHVETLSLSDTNEFSKLILPK